MDQANIIKESLKQFSRSVINVNEASQGNEQENTETYQNQNINSRPETKVDMSKTETSEQETAPQEAGYGKAYYISLLVKNLVVILGTIAIVTGIFACITLKIKCLLAGILLTSNGLLIIAFEAPILLSFVKCIDPIREFSNNRKPIEKIFIYIMPATIVIILCQSFSTVIGTLSVFGVSGLYVFAYLV